MSKYLARVEHTNDYFNLRPVMEQVEDGLMEVNEEKFGQYGTITIGAIYGEYSNSPLIMDQHYCVFEITNEELAALEKNYSGSKIRASEFLAKARTVDSTYIREVIRLPENFNLQDLKKWRRDYITDILEPLSKMIYLMDEECLYGPFIWERYSGNRYKVMPANEDRDDYFVNQYLISDFSEPVYEFDAAKRLSDLYYGQTRRIILNNTLPEAVDEIDLIDDQELKEIVSKLVTRHSDSLKDKREIKNAIVAIPDTEFTEGRKERILKLVENGELADQIVSLIPTAILSDENAVSQIVAAVLDNNNYIDKLYPFIKGKEQYSAIIDKLDEEKKRKEVELTTLARELDEHKEKLSAYAVVDSYQMAELKSENEKLKEVLEEYNKSSELEEEINNLQAKYEELNTQYAMLGSMKSTMEAEVQKKIQSVYTDHVIDGALANLIVKEAAAFERSQRHQNRQMKLLTVENVGEKWDPATPAEAIDFLYEQLTEKAKRNFSRNDVVNLILSMSLGFLTFFAGEPGTGKTSLVSYIATILGLNHSQHGRYTEIAVEKGWTSRRDLIGYYNPLTKSFDAANRGLFNTFEMLHVEAENGINDFPYLILLDEANLSSMEHYWADFMSLCDFEKKNRSITLSEDYVFVVPPTLRFVATINLDHTTEVLSPRLIDRSWIIMLQAPDMDFDDLEIPELEETYPLMTYHIMQMICDQEQWRSKKIEEGIVDKFNKIRVCFKGVGINFSPRVIGMIKRYCLAGKDLFDNHENSYVALDYAVAQKILPIINGYGERYQAFIQQLIAICDVNSMPKSYEILCKIQARGIENMHYYQFFSR